MRNIKFKRRLYSVINKVGLIVSGLGASGIVTSAISEPISNGGVATGLGVAITGLATHLIMYNKEYSYNFIDDYIDSLKDNPFYKSGLLTELDKLDMFEIYLCDPSHRYSEIEQTELFNDLYYDEVLVEKKLEILDKEDESIYDLYCYIEHLEVMEHSKKYLELKKKFLNLNNNISNYPINKKEKNKILKFKNRSN